MSAIFIIKNPCWTFCKVCNNVLEKVSHLVIALFHFFKNLFFLKITYQYKSRACQKKSNMTGDVTQNYRMPANYKGKF